MLFMLLLLEIFHRTEHRNIGLLLHQEVKVSTEETLDILSKLRAKEKHFEDNLLGEPATDVSDYCLFHGLLH